MSGAGKTQGGTRFVVFPQPPVGPGPHSSEIVSLSPQVGYVRPGPSDDRMYTIVPVDKVMTYDEIIEGVGGRRRFLPPWRGDVVRPVPPGPDGHFDHLSPNDPDFAAAHLYASTRFTMDVWEGYLGERIHWHFERRFPRLELVANRDRRVAKMGRGYLEVGLRQLPDSDVHDYALNFDVISHEVGHFILESITGRVRRRLATSAFHALHEMNADCLALITALHFDTVVDELLETTKGNIDTFNRLSRIGEFDRDRQIRLATNEFTLHDFIDGWESEHDLAMPLIGVFFDIFIDLYHETLLAAGAVSQELEELADRAEQDERLLPAVQAGFDAAYAQAPEVFRQALLDARDMGAHMLVQMWRRVRPEDFTFGQVAGWLYDLDRDTQNGRFHRLLRRNLELRGIGLVEPGPHRGRITPHRRVLAPRQVQKAGKRRPTLVGHAGELRYHKKRR